MKETQQSQLPATSTLISGVAVLGLAALISKLMGTLQKIPMQNIGGDEAFGIYNAVFPFYTLILFLATAGFPIAVSKFVSEYMAQGNTVEARRVLRVSSLILTVTGIVFFFILFLGAGYIADLIGNKQTKLAIQSVSFALLFVPIMAALRGYFQGMQTMVPTGVSQVIEQLIRVGTMIALLLYFTSLNLSKEWIAAGATFGSAAGAVAGLVVMLVYTWKDRRIQSVMPTGMKKENLNVLIKKLILYALPVSLGAIVVPVLSIVDTFTMPRMLTVYGLTESEAMAQFGIYARGLPLVQLVAIMFSSLSVALVPSIAEAKFRQNWSVIRHRTELSVRFTWLLGWAASVGLAVAVIPINIMFYTNDLGSLSMSILAFVAIFSSLNIITASILQGLGAVLVPVFSLLSAAILKVALNLLWIPYWGIEGAAAAAVMTFFLASAFNMAAIHKYTGFSFTWRLYFIKPFISLTFMGVFLWVWIEGWMKAAERFAIHIPGRWLATGVSLTAVCLGATIYLLALFRWGAIREKELNYIPGIGKKMIPILKRIRILK
jgi:O-antigen/teichoic acid export membrane protein